MEFIANRPIFPRNSYLVINGVKVNDHNNDGLKFDIEVKSGEEGKVGVGTFKIYNLSQDIEVGSEIELWFVMILILDIILSMKLLKRKRQGMELLLFKS